MNDTWQVCFPEKLEKGLKQRLTFTRPEQCSTLSNSSEINHLHSCLGNVFLQSNVKCQRGVSCKAFQVEPQYYFLNWAGGGEVDF